MKDVHKEALEFYIAHQDELVAKYNGKSIIIVEQEVKGVFDSDRDALREARKMFRTGSYMIKRVGPGKDNYTQTFHSGRISFV